MSLPYLAWYVSITRPKRSPKPFFIISPYTIKQSPERICYRVVNSGDAVAHQFTLFVRFPDDARITNIRPGVFDIVDGGQDKSFVKLQKAQIAPRMSLPDIWLGAERNKIPCLPEFSHAECKEVPKVPIPQPIEL